MEPRLLPSADLAGAGPGLPVDGPSSEPAISVYVEDGALVLPGMELVGDDARGLAGQVVYLDFDGGQGVIYDGPVTVGPVDVPAFELPSVWAGMEQAVVAEVLTGLRQVFADSGVTFTTERPAGDQPYSTIYVGGDGSVFAQYGSFLGLAETVDVGNRNPGDEAFIFSSDICSNASGDASSVSMLIEVIAHETGHLLGYAHTGPGAGARMGDDLAGPLDPVAHATGPDDNQTAAQNAPTHQWLTYNGYLFYDSQFADSELEAYIGDWRDYGSNHHRTNGDNNDVIEGAFDEDVSKPIFYPFEDGFHWDIAPQNPLGQDVAYYQHLVAGGDGAEIYIGWGGHDSAVTQAITYWTSYALPIYATNPALSYYYLGHIAHLIEDLTVPAHVHNDEHPFRDAYEYTVGEYSNCFLWGYGDSMRTQPEGQIEMPGDLVSLLRETIDYTEEYPSDGANGEDELDIPNTGRHRPDLVWGADGFTGDGADLNLSSYNEITILADDLMAWAMEQVAALFRLFYSQIDTTAPDVGFVTSFGAAEGSAVLKPDRFHLAASAQDDLSGYDAHGFVFTVEKKNGDSWELILTDVNSGEFEFIAAGDGLYRVLVEVQDAAGNTGTSTTGYFQVDAARGLAPVYRFWSPVNSRHFFTISQAERDKLVEEYAHVWTYEGVAYYAFATDAEPGVTPVYRFWSGSLSAHFYTTSANETMKLINNYSHVWTFEGAVFYTHAEGFQPAGTSALARFWSPGLECHFFTASRAEQDKLISLYSHVWTYERIAWYVYEA
ncbi:MAG: hypothetical protein A2Y77_14765 [Planctomycetes bacterium RBG_13_62_9]|nr:MAG: hypothetical protein A2Y77_14765 [Planctomycetes bacterium RBG_13_62_9]